MSAEMFGYLLLLGVGVGLVWLEAQLLKLLILEAAMSMSGQGLKKAKRRLWAIPLGTIVGGVLIAASVGLNPLVSAALLGGPLCATILFLVVLRAVFALKRKQRNTGSGGSNPPGNTP